MCVGSGSDDDTGVQRRYMWPPAWETMETKNPVTQSAALGPFRSMIKIRASSSNMRAAGAARGIGTKRKRDDDGTISTERAASMLKLLVDAAGS